MVQMNRKQQIALVIMAAYFIINVQSNIDSFVLDEDEILFRLLDDDRIISDPDLSGLDDSTLRVLSRHISSYIRGKTIISAFNAILLVYLFATYLDLYRHTKSSFTLGLVFLSAALLSYSLFTNPVLLGISSSGGEIEIVKYFNFIPDLLTTLSSTILIYLSRQ
jgi:hypothetical protein